MTETRRRTASRKTCNSLDYIDYGHPADADAPLLVMLHGYGSNERDLFSLAPEFDERLRIISVRAPLQLAEQMYGWFPIDFTDDGITVDRKAAGMAREQLAGFLQEIIGIYRPAGNKVFLLGFSQGAVMNYLTAFSTPELLHGIIALSGQLPDTLPTAGSGPAVLKSLPFLVIHGLYDQILPIDKGREAAAWLKGQVSDLTYREYPMAHQIDDDSLAFSVSWLRHRVNGMVAG